MRIAVAITLTADERKLLETWKRMRSTPARLVRRAKIVLLAAAGWEIKDIAEELGSTRRIVGVWRKRFAERRLAGIEKDAPRPGRPSPQRAELTARILQATLHETPEGATHWSTRSLAEHLGTDKSRVQRVWNAHQLQPHRTKTFKLSRDPQFVEKVVDIVGLYLDPPERAIVLCVDEKSQIQALDRTEKDCRSTQVDWAR